MEPIREKINSPIEKPAKRSKEAPELHKAPTKELHQKISKEAPELHKAPIKAVFEKDNHDLSKIQKRFTEFIQGVKSNNLKKSELTKFYQFLKDARLPISGKDLKDLRIALANPGSRYHKMDVFQKIVKLGNQLERAFGDPIADKVADMKAHSGVMWECVDRIPHEDKGFLYVFRLKKEYDDITPGPDLEERKAAVESTRLKMFPAIETPLSNMPNIYKLFTYNNDLEKMLNDVCETNMVESRKRLAPQLEKLAKEGSKINLDQYIDILRKSLYEKIKAEYQPWKDLVDLGYKIDKDSQGNFYLILPDRDALIQNWEKLREIRPHLKSLDIQSSPGIADPLTFTESYFTYDNLLSEGEEFVHDQTVHIIATLIQLLTPPSASGVHAASKEKMRLIEILSHIYRILHFYDEDLNKNPLKLPEDQVIKLKTSLEIFKTMLSAWVDVITSYENTKQSQIIKKLDVPTNLIETVLKPAEWIEYFAKRFGKENTNPNELKELITEMTHRVNTILKGRK